MFNFSIASFSFAYDLEKPPIIMRAYEVTQFVKQHGSKLVVTKQQKIIYFPPLTFEISFPIILYPNKTFSPHHKLDAYTHQQHSHAKHKLITCREYYITTHLRDFSIGQLAHPLVLKFLSLLSLEQKTIIGQGYFQNVWILGRMGMTRIFGPNERFIHLMRYGLANVLLFSYSSRVP